MLRRSIDGVVDVAAEWVRLGCAAKGIHAESPLAGEEWLAGPMTTVRSLRLLAETLEAGGQPPVRWRTRPNGQAVADVFPATLRERLMYSQMTVEVWVEPGRPPTQGRIYRDKAAGRPSKGGVCLVLGAGNIASIGPLDVIYKLFAEDFVVILKMNPVNAYLAPVFRRAFGPLVDAGYLAIVEGGAKIGEHLAHHPQIDAIHLTGSDRTYDAVVWGRTAEEQARRKAEHRPRVSVPVTAELGCVTPVLVVPGDWSESDLAYQARNVASMVVHNASFNCNAAKVVVLARGWALRERFLARLREALAAIPTRVAYYPGARDRYCQFLDRYPNAIALSAEGDGILPWTLIPDVPPSRDQYALTKEAFCGVVAEVRLDATDATSFLAAAVPFVNETVRGELSCMVLVDAATARRHATGLDARTCRSPLRRHRVNAWAGVNFAIGVASLGRVSGQPSRSHRVGHRRRAQRAAHRSSAEVDRARPVPHVSAAGVVRRASASRSRRPAGAGVRGGAVVAAARGDGAGSVEGLIHGESAAKGPHNGS